VLLADAELELEEAEEDPEAEADEEPEVADTEREDSVVTPPTARAAPPAADDVAAAGATETLEPMAAVSVDSGEAVSRVWFWREAMLKTQFAEGPVYVLAPPRETALFVSAELAPQGEEELDVAPVTVPLATFTGAALTVLLLEEVDAAEEEVAVDELAPSEPLDEVLDEASEVEVEEPLEEPLDDEAEELSEEPLDEELEVDEELDEEEVDDAEPPLLLLLVDELEVPLDAIELASAGLTFDELEIVVLPVFLAS